MKRKLVLCLLFATLICSGAMAADRTGIYVGAEAGSASVNVDASDLVGNGDFDESDTGFKVFGGWRFFKFFGVEGAYADFGSPGSEIGNVDVDVDVTAWSAQAVGYLPISFVDLFAKAGVYRWDVEMKASGFGSNDDNDNDVNYGVGAQFNFGDHFAARIEAERYELKGDDHVDMVSVGALFRF